MMKDLEHVPVVFLVGAGRSGSTWLQLMLSRHPEIATTAETHVFSGYLRLLTRRWEYESESQPPPYKVGLRHLVSEEDFYQMMAEMANGILKRVLQQKDGATLVLEKSPNHAQFWPLILRCLPQARFIHLVRDPRAVAASMLAAGRSWGRHWAPRNVIDAARLWVEPVAQMQPLADDSGTCLEVRYEDLHEDTPGELHDILTWLGFPVSLADCQVDAEACSIKRLRKVAVEDNAIVPSNDTGAFFRKGECEAWRDELTISQMRIVEYLCGELTEHYGYPRLNPGLRRPARLALRELGEALEWRVRTMMNRIVKKL